MDACSSVMIFPSATVPWIETIGMRLETAPAHRTVETATGRVNYDAAQRAAPKAAPRAGL
ncbi:hypothetical protein GCM10023169_30870 [Georgenia halophila]|uniref:Uncharacterized protein n=1 Tax=Georgenia halophila TaxID=620889 RepID=A0ABP8LIM4_9MICO